MSESRKKPGRMKLFLKKFTDPDFCAGMSVAAYFLALALVPIRGGFSWPDSIYFFLGNFALICLFLGILFSGMAHWFSRDQLFSDHCAEALDDEQLEKLQKRLDDLAEEIRARETGEKTAEESKK